MAPEDINVPAPGIGCAVHDRSQQHTALGVVEDPSELDRGEDHEYRVTENGGEQATLRLYVILARSLDEEQGDMPDSPDHSDDKA